MGIDLDNACRPIPRGRTLYRSLEATASPGACKRHSVQVFVQEFGIAGAVAGAPGTTLGGVGGPAADLSDYFSDCFRDRLSRLDAVLGELEALNLKGMTHLPVRLGNQLIEFGVDDPYDKTVTDLIDRVFELEEPLLSMVKSRPRSVPRARRNARRLRDRST